LIDFSYPALQRGNAGYGAQVPNSRRILVWFPSSSSHTYTQAQPNRKIRHFGRDAEIQAMDGNQSVVQVIDLIDLPSLGFPSVDTLGHLLYPTVCHLWTLDFGIPAEMTGL